MSDTQRQGRIAGLIYVALAVLSPIWMLLSRLPDRENAAATAAAIAQSESLFRIGMTTSLACDVIFLCLGVALYRLFNTTSHIQSVLMLTFVIASGAATFVNKLNHVAALTILNNGAGFLSVFTKPQLDALALFFLRLHDDGVYVIALFWGLWLFPLALLVLKSRFVPRIIGILLIVNGFAYVLTTVAFLLFPRYLDLVMRLTIVPKFAGELPFLLWLSIKGAKNPSTDGSTWTA
jgi:hypothetical protein